MSVLKLRIYIPVSAQQHCIYVLNIRKLWNRKFDWLVLSE